MEVLTFGQFCARRHYDVEISHDRLRFPHGISKTMARSNRRAAAHHLGEAFRAARDYQSAVNTGEIRPPNDAEQIPVRLASHPDHESVKATWRVMVKRLCRVNPTWGAGDAIRSIIATHFPDVHPFADELGCSADSTIGELADARLNWMQKQESASA